MRIAVVCHTHPSVTKGGAEIAAYTLFEALLAAGHDAIFVAAVPETARATVALASAREFAVGYDAMRYDHFYHLSEPAVWRDLVAVLVRERVTVAHFHHFIHFGTDGLAAAQAIPGLRVVLTLHEFLAICHHHGQMVTRPDRFLCRAASETKCTGCFPEHTRQQFAVRRLRMAAMLAGCAALIAPSRFLADRFAAWGVPGRRLHVIPNGLARAAIPARAHDPQRPWVFGFFGQITPFKGVQVLLRVAGLLAHEDRAELAARIRIRLHGPVVGHSDADRAALLSACAGSDVIGYDGAYENEAVGELMAECDYVLMPSLWWENAPVVIAEAQAAGRPVICSGIGGMAEAVQDGVTGLHARVGDAGDWLATLARAADPAVHARLCAAVPRPPDAASVAAAHVALFASHARVDAPAMEPPRFVPT